MARNDFTPASRRLILLREEGCCAWCGRPYGDSLNIHHRLLRGQGGTGDLQNGIALCGSGTTGCHGDAHANPKRSRERGHIVPSWDDPLLIPVMTWRGLLLLDDTGTFRQIAT